MGNQIEQPGCWETTTGLFGGSMHSRTAVWLCMEDLLFTKVSFCSSLCPSLLVAEEAKVPARQAPLGSLTQGIPACKMFCLFSLKSGTSQQCRTVVLIFSKFLYTWRKRRQWQVWLGTEGLARAQQVSLQRSCLLQPGKLEVGNQA